MPFPDNSMAKDSHPPEAKKMTRRQDHLQTAF